MAYFVGGVAVKKSFFVAEKQFLMFGTQFVLYTV
jgi:hypothetical protein